MNEKLYINMRDRPSAPEDPSYYLNISDKEKAFWQEEEKKVLEGVNIDGYQFSGWLYWHINHWCINMDEKLPNGEDISIAHTPLLRDNEIILNEALLLAEDYHNPNPEERKKKGLIILGLRQMGKLQPDYELVMKSSGEVRIDSLVIGDKIFGKDGNLHNVTGIFLQGKKPIYRMFLTDGRYVDSGDEHLWEVWYDKAHKKILTTKQLRESKLTYKHIRSGVSYKYRLPECNPVEFTNTNLPINPYLLGLLLGDGSTVSATPRLSIIDEEIIDTVRTILGADYYIHDEPYEVVKLGYPCRRTIKYIGKDKYTLGKYKTSTRHSKYGVNPLNRELDKLGLCVNSYNKFIPELYKLSTVSDRMELLQGLMDSDGSVTTNGNCEFKVVNERLAKDVVWLCRSLGIRCEINSKNETTNIPNGDTCTSFVSRVYIRTDKPIFKLKRKLDRLKKRKNTSSIAISHFEYVGDFESRCISVDAEDSLYLTRDFIVTHNTTFEASYSGRSGVIFKGSQNLILGTTLGDLNNITSHIDFGLLNCTPWFRTPRITRDWDSERVQLGFKNTKGDNQVWSQYVIRNTAGGKNTEAGAGTTIKSLVYDEIGKDDFIQAFVATKPAMIGRFGYRAVPILVGCVCAGTKVWNNKGELLNIEDLVPENGIIGYNGKQCSRETITYWQPPKETECYRIVTNKGTTLECSHDHPILYRSRNEMTGGKRKTYFKETKNLKRGDQIALIEEVSIFSEKELWEPRFLGWLIGDGSYGFDKTPVLSNCDNEINDYINSNFNTVVEKSYITKENKTYQETRIKDICPMLREIGIYGQTKNKKTLPLNIHSYSEKSICELIGGLWDTDGTVSYNPKTPPATSLCCGYKELLSEIKLLLQKLGVHSSITFHKPNKNNPIDRNGHYRLNVTDRKSLITFHKKIKFCLPYKQDKLDKNIILLKNRKNQVPSEIEGLRFERIISVDSIGVKPVYNLTAGITNTYVANGIVTHNTGGSFEKGEDAQNLFFKPSTHNLVEYIQPDGRTTGLFMPGTLRQDCKYKTNLGQWLLDTKRLESIPPESELFTIQMEATNVDVAIHTILQARENALNDPDPKAWLKEVMYYPLTVDEVFLTDTNNNFPIRAIERHITNLGENYSPRAVDLFRELDGSVGWKNSERREILQFPIERTTLTDAPVIIYEEPNLKLPYATYVCGIDPYNQDASSGNNPSLGSIYIIKRLYDPLGHFQNSIVASYAGRPRTLKEFYELCEMMIDMYKAVALPENESSIIQYFIQKQKEHVLFDSPALTRYINPSSATANRQKGLAATTPNQRHYMKLMVEYCMEQVAGEPEENVKDENLGIIRIPDIMLLKEMRAYRGKSNGTQRGVHDGNFDRICAFGHALTLANYLDRDYPLKSYRDTSDDIKVKEPRFISPFIIHKKDQKNPSVITPFILPGRNRY